MTLWIRTIGRGLISSTFYKSSTSNMHCLVRAQDEIPPVRSHQSMKNNCLISPVSQHDLRPVCTLICQMMSIFSFGVQLRRCDLLLQRKYTRQIGHWLPLIDNIIAKLSIENTGFAGWRQTRSRKDAKVDEKF